MSVCARVSPVPWKHGAVVLLSAALVIGSYHAALIAMARRWVGDAEYTHGLLVPLFSLYLLWHRRDLLAKGVGAPSWWGALFLVAGIALRLLGLYAYVDFLIGLSLLPVLVGLCVLAGGWKALSWAWPGILFLIFMIPLPYRAEKLLALPLQHSATLASTYVLQTLGFPALAEGNVILIDETRINVVEACSGLSMLLTFLALATATVLVSRRPVLDKVLVLLATVPVGLGCNVVRISATGALHELLGSQTAHLVFHDLAGWLMMPLAVAILLAALRLLTELLPSVTGNAKPPERSRRAGTGKRSANTTEEAAATSAAVLVGR
jgi:exosortase